MVYLSLKYAPALLKNQENPDFKETKSSELILLHLGSFQCSNTKYIILSLNKN